MGKHIDVLHRVLHRHQQRRHRAVEPDAVLAQFINKGARGFQQERLAALQFQFEFAAIADLGLLRRLFGVVECPGLHLQVHEGAFLHHAGHAHQSNGRAGQVAVDIAGIDLRVGAGAQQSTAPDRQQDGCGADGAAKAGGVTVPLHV